MKIQGLAVAFVLTALSAAPGLTATPPDYLKGPAIFDATLSADGKQLAYATVAGAENHIIVQGVDDRALLADINLGTQRISDVQWAGADHVIIYTIREDNLPGFVKTYRDNTYARAFNLKTHKMVQLSMNTAHALSYVNGHATIHESAGATMALIRGQSFNVNDSHASVAAFYDINLDNGQTQEVDRSSQGFGLWQANSAGLVLAKVQATGKLDGWTLNIRESGDWKAVGAGEGDSPFFIGLDGDGRPLLVLRRGDGFGVKRLEPNGSLSDVGPIQGYAGAVLDESTQRLIALIYRDGVNRRYRFLDKADQARWQSVERAYPGQALTWVSASNDHGRLIVRVEPPKDTPYLAYVDLAAGKSRVIGDIYPALKPSDVSAQTVVAWKGADGMPLQGLLTRARDAKPTDKTPLIVYAPPGSEPPGLGYAVRAQALAAAGYSVFEPTHRGMADGLDGSLSQKAITDIAEGVKAVIGAGGIDAKRVCILSFSPAGGYTVLAALIHDPDLYQCGVAEDGGYFDLKEFSRSTPSSRGITRDFGIDQVNDSTLEAISPAHNASMVKSPVLFTQPAADKSIPVEQARSLARAIVRAGGKAKSVDLEGDSEARMSEAGRLKRFETTLTFLKQAIP